MKIHSPRDGKPETQQRSDTFTGQVWGQPVLTNVENLTYNNVMFAPNSRTYWHRHGDGQVLHVTAGKGLIRSRDGEEQHIAEGDTVWIPAGEDHYHGAAPDSFMIHQALSFGQTQWLEEVDDSDYGASA